MRRWTLGLLTVLGLVLLVGGSAVPGIAQPAASFSAGVAEAGPQRAVRADSRTVQVSIPARFGPQIRATSTITVNYQEGVGDCQTWPASAKAAHEYGRTILQNLIVSSVPITVEACWKPLGTDTLGTGGGSYWTPGGGDTWAPVPGFAYPLPVARALSSSNLDPGSPDVQTSYASGRSDWYFGTDAQPPAGQFDFVTVMLHEVIHGLGFGGTAYQLNPTTYRWRLSSGVADSYDRNVVRQDGTTLVSLFPDRDYPSGTAFADLMVGLNGGLWWDGAEGKAANGGVRPRLYTPNPWVDGSSYGHLDAATFPWSPLNLNAVLGPSLPSGAAIHCPGTVVFGIMKDLGWGNRFNRTCSSGGSTPTVTATSTATATATSTPVTPTPTPPPSAGTVTLPAPTGGTTTGSSSVGGTTVTVTLSGASGGGTVNVTQQFSAPSQGTPPWFRVLTRNFVLTSSVTFSSGQVCFTYSEADLSGASIAESQLRLLHYPSGGTAWRDITAAGSPDTAANTICGTVSSFSPFMLGVGSSTMPVAIRERDLNSGW